MDALRPFETAELTEDQVVVSGWYTLRRARLRLTPIGGPGRQVVREAVARGDRAAALLLDPRRRTVLLLRQFRLAAFLCLPEQGWPLEVCGGLMDGGESPEQCLRREIGEELGLRPDALIPAFKLLLAPMALAEICHLYVAHYDGRSGIPGVVTDPREAGRVDELPLRDALQRVRRGEIVDARTVLLLLHAASP